jgi:hypothetical protein
VSPHAFALHDLDRPHPRVSCPCGWTQRPRDRTLGSAQDAWCRHLTTVDVAQLVGVTFRQLDYWLRRGWVPAPNPTPGSGNQRVWTRELVRCAAVMAALVRAGLTPDAASELARTDQREIRRPGVAFTIIVSEVVPW